MEQLDRGDETVEDDALDQYEGLDDDDELDGPIVPDDYDDFDDADSDDYDDDYDDEYEDASFEDLDFAVALYREDGEAVVQELTLNAANDLEEMIEELRRLPGDAGALGVVSILGDFFVLVRVRGRNVQVLLNDSLAALEWPIARDVMDFLNIDIPEDGDEDEVIGDTEILLDQGVSDFDLEQIAGNIDEDSDQLALQIIKQMRFADAFHAVITDED